MQRRLERTIRKQKRLVNARKAAGLKEDTQTANIKFRRLETKYTQFSKAANLPEYTERKNVLYSDSKSLEKAQQLRVQRHAEAAAKELKQQQNRAILKEKIQSGEISTELRQQVQARHIEGAPKFEEYLAQRLAKGQTPQSILTVTLEEAQELVDRYNCTGEIVIKTHKDGALEIREYTDVDRTVGKEYTDDEYRDTKRISIVYAKKGTHIVPVQPKERMKNV